MTTTEPQQFAPQTTADPGSRRGGKPGNRNATRHGLRGSRLPEGCSYIQKSLSRFRWDLEQAVVDARGEITLVDAANINTAYRWERHAQLTQRWLAKEADKMSAADRLAYSRDTARASESRDRAIAQLDLDQRGNLDPWAALDAHPAEPPAKISSSTETS